MNLYIITFELPHCQITVELRDNVFLALKSPTDRELVERAMALELTYEEKQEIIAWTVKRLVQMG